MSFARRTASDRHGLPSVPSLERVCTTAKLTRIIKKSTRRDGRTIAAYEQASISLDFFRKSYTNTNSYRLSIVFSPILVTIF